MAHNESVLYGILGGGVVESGPYLRKAISRERITVPIQALLTTAVCCFGPGSAMT